MKLALVSLFVVGVLFMGRRCLPSPAAQLTTGAVTDMQTLLVRLNGVPRAVGVLTSTGTSVTQTTTVSTFTRPRACFWKSRAMGRA